ncbi:hypothetical protein OYC64_010333 [Pagothenia borchgrevinki]|uniref:Uncharacterized protein n=1 Tax=Pagothenia borchgrevinki TaxID=8213 RepID=A0ABD2GVC2_PAGBO
MNLELLVLSY